MDIRLRIPFATFVTLAGLSLLGCSDHRAKWVGTWDGFLSLENRNENPDLATVDKVELIISADSKINLYLRGFPVEGSGSLGAKSAKLRILQVAGQPLESQPTDIQAEYQNLKLEYQSTSQIELQGVQPGNITITLTKRNEE